MKFATTMFLLVVACEQEWAEFQAAGKVLAQPDIPILGQEIEVEVVQDAMDGPFTVQ